MAKLDLKLYHRYLQSENGRNVMYVNLKNALYGALEAALLFWKNLTAKLKSWGFTINLVWQINHRRKAVHSIVAC